VVVNLTRYNAGAVARSAAGFSRAGLVRSTAGAVLAGVVDLDAVPVFVAVPFAGAGAVPFAGALAGGWLCASRVTPQTNKITSALIRPDYRTCAIMHG
jgi:hypothetical protein